MTASAQLTMSLEERPRCAHCERPMPTRSLAGKQRKRRDARTCSKSCRQKLSRKNLSRALTQKGRAISRRSSKRKPARRRELLTNAARRRALEGVTL